MGLDNGLFITTKHPENFTVPKEFVWRDRDWSGVKCTNGSSMIYSIYSREVCYWRKCWNIREEIIKALGDRWDGDIYKFELTVEELKRIWKSINSLNKKKVWNNSESIWDYSDMRAVLDQDLINIEWVIEEKKKNPDEFRIYFYDSY